MKISPIIGILLIALWMAGVGSLGFHNWRRLQISKAQGFFEHGLGTRISRSDKPTLFKAALAIYWFGVAMAIVMLVGGLLVMFELVKTQ